MPNNKNRSQKNEPITIEQEPQQISKRNVIVFFTIAALIILAIVFIPIIQQQLMSAKDRIAKIYEEMTSGLSSGSSINKVGTNGIHFYDGSEVVKPSSNDAIYIKYYNEDLSLLKLSLMGVTDKAKLDDKLSSAQKQYGDYYDSAIKAGELPSEFFKLEIDNDFKGVASIPIGANSYIYYALYSQELDDLEAAYDVCSVFYSEYGDWGDGEDEDGFPTSDATTLSDKQLRLSDKGRSLVMTIEPRSLSYPDRNNIGRCVRGVLEMPERIRKEFEDDWLEYANGSSSARNANSTRTYNWDGFEMKVKHSSTYQYGSGNGRGKTEYTSEITIYYK